MYGIRNDRFYDCDSAIGEASGASVMCGRDTAIAVRPQVCEFVYTQFRNEFAALNIRRNCMLSLTDSSFDHFRRTRRRRETSNVPPPSRAAVGLSRCARSAPRGFRRTRRILPPLTISPGACPIWHRPSMFPPWGRYFALCPTLGRFKGRYTYRPKHGPSAPTPHSEKCGDGAPGAPRINSLMLHSAFCPPCRFVYSRSRIFILFTPRWPLPPHFNHW